MIVPTGRIALTDRIDRNVLADRNNQSLSPNRVDQAFNLQPVPDHRQAWVVPPERREAVGAKFEIGIMI